MCGGSCWHWMAFAGACWCLLVPDGVFLVSYGVWRWEEGVWGFTQSVYECCLWTWLRFGSLWGSIWVFRPCMMQQMLYIGKSPKGEIPHTWHFWNIKIPKPPYVSSLKIIGLLHLFKFLGPSKENYNLQSLWITLYNVCQQNIIVLYTSILTFILPASILMLHRLNDEAALWLNNRPNAQSGPQFWSADGVDRSRDVRNLYEPKLGWGLGHYKSSWLGLGLVHLPRLPQSF